METDRQIGISGICYVHKLYRAKGASTLEPVEEITSKSICSVMICGSANSRRQYVNRGASNEIISGRKGVF